MQTIDEALGKKRVICLLLAVSLLVLGTGCSKLLPQEEDSLAVPLVTPASVEYKTYTCELSDISNNVSMVGDFYAASQQNLYFTFDQGRLLEMLVEAGDTVTKGDVLATVDTVAIDEQITLQQYEVDRAQKNYDMTTDGTAERDLANIELKKQKYIKSMLVEQMDGSSIVAPYDGVITYTNKLAVGEVVSAYQTVITIADPTSYIVETDSEDAASLSVGAVADVVYKDVTYQATVIETPTTIDEESTSGQTAYLQLNDGIPEGANNGANVTINYVTEESSNVIVVPKSAVIYSNNRQYVYVLSDGIRVEADVAIGIIGLTSVEILSGLSVGDVVILN